MLAFSVAINVVLGVYVWPAYPESRPIALWLSCEWAWQWLGSRLPPIRTRHQVAWIERVEKLYSSTDTNVTNVNVSNRKILYTNCQDARDDVYIYKIFW